ncbi:SpoIIE family protein phosphatase [Paracrocinitomix mangrovi]|uniref:two-component regulator propeller domain-containing protein n=1 Tax=Paracrocinitomix mangrovi TaxID=2862509 RepID=UPI001C8E4B11|nr:two-component regulator propeller domain-containing protein [Paracrocinitomix mangrovi]UKN03691.1 SpoIIE family protein phosphatase [Paracrocinitomix mangrovi]
MNSLRIVFVISLALLLTNCSEKEAINDVNLLANAPKDTLQVDTIRINETIDFKPDTSFYFEEVEPNPVFSPQIPFKSTNIFEANDTIVYDKPTVDTVFKANPTSQDAKPYISYVSHPQPIKAGELRSSPISSENIQVLGVGQNLPNPTVSQINEDKYGFLWFATSTGLVRYDGNYFLNYTTENGLLSDNVIEVFFDSKDNMWLATYKGLMKYDGNRIESYTRNNGLKSLIVHNLREDQDGNIWFIEYQNGVTKFDGEKFYNYNMETGIKSNNVMSMNIDQDNRVLVGNFYMGPDYIVGDEIHSFDETYEYFGSLMLQQMSTTKKGEILIATYGSGGAALLDNGKSYLFKGKTGIPYSSMSKMIDDQNGNYWFASYEAGVSHLKNDQYIGYTTTEGLSSNIAIDIFEDSKGNIWVATEDGVNKIVPNSFTTINGQHGFTEKSIVNMHLTSDNKIAVATATGGVWIYDKKLNVFYHYMGGLIVKGLGEDYFGNLIAGAHQFGTRQFIASKNDTICFESQLDITATYKTPAWGVNAIITDKDGNLWLGDDTHGMIKYSLNEDKTAYNKAETYSNKSGLASKRISDMIFDKEGYLWIMHGSLGLSKMKDGKINHYTTQNGLPSNFISSATQLTSGEVWLASNDGLIRFQNNAYNLITTADGLTSNIITSITEDNQNRVWIGTSNGINLLIPDNSEEKGYAIIQFGINDGLISADIHPRSAVLDNDNIMWWGTSNGLVKLDLNTFDQSTQINSTYITNVDLMNEHVDYTETKNDTLENLLEGVEYTGTAPYFNSPTNLSLPYDINTVTFHYSSLNGSPSYQVKYRYKLEGFEEEWSKPLKTAEAKFTNLSPGKYQFVVQSKVQSNDWGPTTTFEFEIRPPFWQRWWFRLLTLAAIIYLVYFIVRLRNKQLRKRQEELEQTVKERTSEIELQKHVIEEKQTEILDSINYAQRIQKALLATDEMLSQHLKDYFVFFQPKDIVSGDFYWATPSNDDQFIIVTADSTGHGVPGAIMSMLNISCLEKATETAQLTEPAQILDFTRAKIIETLAKDGSKEGGKDGMDCSLIKFDLKNLELTYAAAHNGLWIIRNNELMEFKSDKMPVGKHAFDSTPFTQTTIQLEKGDIVYTFTDGYPDQFGGDKGKKFKYKSLKKLLLELHHLPMNAQKEALIDHFNIWKGDLEQLDDVCVIGVKI